MSRSVNRIKRYRDTLYAIVVFVDKLKWKVEELKIVVGEEIVIINAWCDKVEAEIAVVDDDVDSIFKRNGLGIS